MDRWVSTQEVHMENGMNSSIRPRRLENVLLNPKANDSLKRNFKP